MYSNIIFDLLVKLVQSEEKIKQLRREKKKLQDKVRSLSGSRSSWKKKYYQAKSSGTTSQSPLDRAVGGLKPFGHQYPLWLMQLCVSLRVESGLSYAGIVQSLASFKSHLGIIQGIPCAHSIRNWVEKSGLSLLCDTQQACPYQEPALIIDESISMGPDKLLMVLATEGEVSEHKALDYESVRVVHLSAQSSCKTDRVTQVLGGIQADWQGKVAYVLGDGDRKLRAASERIGLPYLLDISHLLATCLKKTFHQQPSYKDFRKDLAKWRSKGVCQEDISFLLPPKQRKKARFMNQSSLLKWFKKMKTHWKGLPHKAQDFYQGLHKHQAIVWALGQCLEITQIISQKLKIEGLSKTSLEAIEQVLNQRTDQLVPLAQKFKQYLLPYLESYKHTLADQTLHCTSDIIESMFGKYKAFASLNPLGNISGACLQIPLHTLNTQALNLAVEQGVIKKREKDVKEWKKKNIPENLLIKRNRAFRKVA